MNIHNVLHKLVVAVVMFIGFGIALGWPQYQKHRTIQKAAAALELGKEIAFLEAKHKEKYGVYEPDFSHFDLSQSCTFEEKDGHPEALCGEYVFYWKDGNTVHIHHPDNREWFEVYTEQGTMGCFHEPDSWAGAHICDKLKAEEMEF